MIIAIEINLARGKEVLNKAGIKHDVANTIEGTHRIMERGETILIDNIDLALELEDVNVVIDAAEKYMLEHILHGSASIKRKM